MSTSSPSRFAVTRLLSSEQTEQLQALRGSARERWQALAERERLAVALAGAALALLLLWSIAVQPALRTLRSAPARLAELDAELQQMQRLALEAKELRAQPSVPTAQAQQALKAASEHLGAQARLNISGDRAVLTLNGISPEALQAWLGEARSAARARPVEANLQRGPQGYGGSIVLALGSAAP